jgi:hypothetical protein
VSVVQIAFAAASQAPGFLRHRAGRLRHVVEAALAGEHVGVAGVDDDRPGPAAADALAAPLHRRSRHGGAGQHARDRRAGRQLGQHQVGAGTVADAGGKRPQLQAGNLRQLGKAGGRKRRTVEAGHESVPGKRSRRAGS